MSTTGQGTSCSYGVMQQTDKAKFTAKLVGITGSSYPSWHVTRPDERTEDSNQCPVNEPKLGCAVSNQRSIPFYRSYL